MFHWWFLGTCILVAAVGSGLLAVRAIRAYGTARKAWLDLLALTTLIPIGLFSIQAYVSRDLVGAGDSYFYGLQVADFASQVRSGVMPVLVGQSDFAFNGNVHPIRTAPYFTHLAGLIDGVTGRRLPFVGLQNLTVAVTAVLAAWAAYGACLLLSGGRRMASWLLAVLYSASPGIIGPLALGDMFATYMAAPWLILCWSGLAGIIQHEDDGGPQLLAAGSLAMVWYAHAPIAAWLSLIWAAIQTVKVVLAGGTGRHWIRVAMIVSCLLVLTAYVLASLATIKSGPMTPSSRPTGEYIPASVEHILLTQFQPILFKTEAPGIQLGLSMWIGIFIAGAVVIRTRQITGLLLIIPIGGLIGYLLPSPIYDQLWRLLPDQLAAQSAWPEQRLCPLLASGAVAVIAIALRELVARPPVVYRTICWLLALACIWSAAEAAILNRRPGLARRSPAMQAVIYSPDNLVLTRYSYIFSERIPPYFSHGWTDPEFETRLLTLELDPALDNTTATLQSAGSTNQVPVAPTAVIDLTGPGEYLLHFGFEHPEEVGELSIRNDTVFRHYALPKSGEPMAFGSHPSGSKAIPLRLRQPGTQQFVLRSTVSGTSLRVFPVNRATLPIRLAGQMPYTVALNAAEAGFVETPKLFLEGYTAVVNGVHAMVRPSPNGLVMVPVPQGRSEVTLQYRGPTLVRAAWLLSVAGSALLPWLLAGAWGTLVPLRWNAGEQRDWISRSNIVVGLTAAWNHRRNRCVGAAVATVILIAAVAAGLQIWRAYTAFGSLELVVELPKRPDARAEPLLTVGKTGAADCVFVIYEDAHHIRLGYDHWGFGGPISDPIPVQYGAPHRIEISLRGLYPGAWWLNRPDPAATAKDGLFPFLLKLDDQTIFDHRLPSHPANIDEVAVGANPAGSSMASPSYSGRILTANRRYWIPPPAPSSMQ